jgi:hypothetical protein
LKAEVIFAGLPVADIGSALDWYERFLGSEPDPIPHGGGSQLSGLRTIPVSSLGKK